MSDEATYPEKVESVVCEALAGDVLGQLFYHGRVLLHGYHTAGNQLPVLACGKVPGSNTHQVIKCELQDQPALCHHL